MLGTRPDIVYAISKLSQYNKRPALKHWQAVQRVFYYLSETANYRITYSGVEGEAKLVGYSDVD